MRFLESPEHGELTYSDVFLVPSLSEVPSRYEVDLAAADGTGMTIPLIASNMNAVSGPRLAAAIARRGGIAVLPQDLEQEKLVGAIHSVKQGSPHCNEPFVVAPTTTVAEALTLLPAHKGLLFVVRQGDSEHGAVAAETLADADPSETMGTLARNDWPVLDEATAANAEEAYSIMLERGSECALVRRGDRTVGTLSRAGAVRASVYRPNVDANGALAVAAAVGINGDVTGRAQALVENGANVLVLDTAHGHQRGMITAVERVSALNLDVPIVAGNVVTGQAARDLVNAGATIVKVGVGPGAMCTTRMMTGVGRPQFSAVLEAAEAARALGANAWADGGVQHPRDVALALAAGASGVMIGSWFASNIESPGEIQREGDGSLFKTNWGMASTKAVNARFAGLSAFEQARKAMFSEGISESRIRLDPERPSIEDTLDAITAGVRSAMTYAGARTLDVFHERAVVGVQTASGYDEGRAKERISR